MAAPILGIMLIVLGLIVAAGFVQYPTALVLLGSACTVRSPLVYTAFSWFSGHVIASWLSFVAIVFELCYGIRYHFYEDNGEGTVTLLRAAVHGRTSAQGHRRTAASPSGVVIISNHRTRLDWALLWPLMSRSGTLSSLKIILKEGLRWAPLFMGPAIQIGRYLFLHRRWEADAVKATTLYGLLRHGPRTAGCCGRRSRVPSPYSLLLFPEGTDLHPAARDKSWAFSDANKGKDGRPLPRLECVLQPRVKGLAHAIYRLAGVDGLQVDSDHASGSTSGQAHATSNGVTAAAASHSIDAATAVSERPLGTILDFTLAYEGGVPQNEACLVGLGMGAYPQLRPSALDGLVLQSLGISAAQEHDKQPTGDKSQSNGDAAAAGQTSTGDHPSATGRWRVPLESQAVPWWKRSAVPKGVHVHVKAWPVESIVPRHVLAGQPSTSKLAAGSSPSPGSCQANSPSPLMCGVVPCDIESAVNHWLQQRFAVKEVALRVFYALQDRHLLLRQLRATPSSGTGAAPQADRAEVATAAVPDHIRDVSPVLDMPAAEQCLQACDWDISRAAEMLFQLRAGGAGAGAGAAAVGQGHQDDERMGRRNNGRQAASKASIPLAARPGPSPVPWARYALILLWLGLTSAAALYTSLTWPRAVGTYLVLLTATVYWLVPRLLSPVKGGGLDDIELAAFGPQLDAR